MLTLAICLSIGACLVLAAVAVSSAYASNLSVTRTYSGGDVSPSNPTVDINQLSLSETLNSGTTPAVTKDFDTLITLSGGTATLDLTSITDAIDASTKTITGLTPAHFKFVNPSTNANAITIAKGASNGYTGFGSSLSITLPPGGELLLRLGASTVGGSSKTLDISGTGSQTLKVQGTAG